MVLDKDFVEAQGVEEHPLGFFSFPDSKILMMGSFPPPKKRWVMDFYYPNRNNDMWRIFGLIFFNDGFHFLTPDRKHYKEAELRAFLRTKGFALGDTAQAVIREKNNASDKHLIVVRPLDLAQVLQGMPQCHTLITTGQKSSDILAPILHTTDPKVGEKVEVEFASHGPLTWWRMPSSSRAYPKPLEWKADFYRKVFASIGLC